MVLLGSLTYKCTYLTWGLEGDSPGFIGVTIILVLVWDRLHRLIVTLLFVIVGPSSESNAKQRYSEKKEKYAVTLSGFWTGVVIVFTSGHLLYHIHVLV